MQISFFFFVFAYFFILVKAMSESTLKNLRQEARKSELERKVEAFKREQIERERVEQVQLIRTIYVEPLTSHAPTTKEIRIFEQEQRNRELEEEL